MILGENSSFYDSFAQYYDEYALKRNKYIESIDEIIVSLVDKRNLLRMLDVGSGSGKRTVQLVKSFNIEELFITEPSQNMLQLCRFNSNELNMKVRLMSLDYLKRKKENLQRQKKSAYLVIVCPMKHLLKLQIR